MRYLGAVFVFVGGMLLHWWWSTYVTLWGVAPHLLLILTVATAASAGPVVGQCYGFAWGLFLDTVGVHLFGANALIFTAAAYLVGSARRQMDVSSPVSQTMAVGVVTVGHLVGLVLLGLLFERQAFWAGWTAALISPLINALAAPFLFPVIQRTLGEL